MNRRVRRQRAEAPPPDVVASLVATLDDPRVGAVSAALSRLRPEPAAAEPRGDSIETDAVEAEIVLADEVVPEEIVFTPPWSIALDGTLLPPAPLHRIGWRERAAIKRRIKRKRRSRSRR